MRVPLVNQFEIQDQDLLHTIAFMKAGTEDHGSVAYAKLARMAAGASERLWVLRPKLHAPHLQLMIAKPAHMFIYMLHIHVYVCVCMSTCTHICTVI